LSFDGACSLTCNSETLMPSHRPLAHSVWLAVVSRWWSSSSKNRTLMSCMHVEMVAVS